eukprot:scaffold2232_cov111-Skeletonema_marinoi.AAC.2
MNGQSPNKFEQAVASSSGTRWVKQLPATMRYYQSTSTKIIIIAFRYSSRGVGVVANEKLKLASAHRKKSW